MTDPTAEAANYVPAGYTYDDKAWLGRRMPKTAPFLTKAGAWNAWNSGSLQPMYDLGEDVAEFARRRTRARRWLIWTVAIAGFGLLAWLPILTGR
jgi:hypothetical protein